MRLGAQSPVGQTPMKRSRGAGTPRPGDQPKNWWATGPRNGGHQPKNWTGSCYFLTLSAPTCSSWTLAVTCPRSCVAVVQWFGAWYFAVGRNWYGFLAYLSLFRASPWLSSSVYLFSLGAFPTSESVNSRGTVPYRGTAAKGFICIPCCD